jgi:hypothetical protein
MDCAPAGSTPDPQPDPPAPALHAPLEETLLAASETAIVLARATYTSVDPNDPSAHQQMTQLRVVAIEPDTGELLPLEQVLAARLIAVPVTDGRWLAGIDEAHVIWLADLVSRTAEPLVNTNALSAPIEALYALQHPWLAGRDAAGPFIYNLVTRTRTGLDPGVQASSLVLEAEHAAWFYAADPSSDVRELRLMNLNSGQTLTLASLPATRLQFYNGQLLWMTFDATAGTHLVNSHTLSTGETAIVLRLKKVPLPGETQFIVDRGPRGYLLQHHSPNPNLPITMEELEIYRINGDRDDYIGWYGLLPQEAVVIGQPRFAGERVVYRDPNDGFWVIVYLETSGSRRLNPFP